MIVNNAEPEPLDVAVKNVMIELEQILAKFEPKSERTLYQWITDAGKGCNPSTGSGHDAYDQDSSKQPRA